MTNPQQSLPPSEWYFITPPQSVSWSKESSASEVAAWGTNEPYLNYSTTHLRKLTLGNALVEGFSDAKAIEDNIVQLEACMRMILGDGYASPYCYHAYAGGKSYGTFIITGVTVKEDMRDMSGNATRAYVDVELQEVPRYQVASGIDLTSPATGGRLTSESAYATGELGRSQNTQVNNQDAAVNQANGNGNGNGNTPSGPVTIPDDRPLNVSEIDRISEILTEATGIAPPELNTPTIGQG